MTTQRSYRKRIYIVKDIILNSPILGRLETKGLISKDRIEVRKRTVTAYKPTQKGIEFSRHILEPCEIMFPRSDTIPADNLAFLLILI